MKDIEIRVKIKGETLEQQLRHTVDSIKLVTRMLKKEGYNIEAVKEDAKSGCICVEGLLPAAK
jgi:hypothetical protein